MPFETVTYVMITNQSRDNVDRSIRSVHNELGPNDDLVVVGKTAGLPELSQVTYVENEKWALFGNTSHMRNAGFDNSLQNDIVVFMDDDMLLPVGYREAMMDYANAHEDFTSVQPKIITSNGYAIGKLLRHQNFPMYVSMFFAIKREVFQEIRWNENYGYYYGPADDPVPEDVKFSYDMVYAGYVLQHTLDFYAYLNDDAFYVYYGMVGQHHIDKVNLRPINMTDKLVVARDRDYHTQEIKRLLGD